MNRILTLAALSLSAMPALAAAPGGLKDALSGERLGLLPAEHFRVANGHCTDCPTLKQGLWYFGDQTLAVPLGAQALSSHGATSDIVRSARRPTGLTGKSCRSMRGHSRLRCAMLP